MKKSASSFAITLFLLSLSILHPVVHSKNLIIFKNQCDEPVWPLAKSNGGSTPLLLPTTASFVVEPGESKNISVPPSWSGSIWGRTRCSMEDSGDFHCLIGDCGSDKVGCGGESDLLQPASTTIAAFTLNATDGMDYYAVTLQNGFNLPITVAPADRSGGDDCTTAGCAVNLTSSCPQELRYSDESLGCKSACQAFGEPRYCYSNPYTDVFKETCPKANSFVNDNTSTCSCPSFGHDFHIIFCPSSSTTRSTSPDKWPTEPTTSDSESAWQRKINDNSEKWNKYKIAALISVALLTATLSIAVSFRAYCCNGQIITS